MSAALTSRSYSSAVSSTNLRLPRRVISTGPRRAASTTSSDRLFRSVREKWAMRGRFQNGVFRYSACLSDGAFLFAEFLPVPHQIAPGDAHLFLRVGNCVADRPRLAAVLSQDRQRRLDGARSDHVAKPGPHV